MSASLFNPSPVRRAWLRTMIADLVAIGRAGAETLREMKGETRIMLVRGCAYVAFAYLSLFGIELAYYGGDFNKAFHGSISRIVGEPDMINTRDRARDMQIELRAVSRADQQINEILTRLLTLAPGAARVRIGVIHNGVSGITGNDMLRFDVSHAQASPGHTGGELVTNVPLSGWSDVLPALLADQCTVGSIESLRNENSRSRLLSTGAKQFAACPIRNTENMLLGAVFMNWDDQSAPTGAEMVQLQDKIKSAGMAIAVAIDLRDRIADPTPTAH